MVSREQDIQELERKRAALNQQLMNAQTLAEANRIERELQALRIAISYHRARLTNKYVAGQNPTSRPPQ